MSTVASRARNRRAPWRPSVLAVGLGVLVYLAGSVGGYLHFATVRHERCPEHGELIHAEATGQGALASSLSAPLRDTALDTIAGGSTADDSHDPCSIVASLGKRWSAEIGSTEVPACRADSEPCPPARAPSRPSLAVWKQAPKTSPPAALA